MSFRGLFRACNIIRPFISRSVGTYKTVKRPDPKTLKMPAPGTAPSLIEIIKEKVRLNGPLTVAEYMHIIVTNPTDGYYMKKETIGESGDFITSPEISQLFGEMVGIWFCVESQKMGPSSSLQIVELGPGKGTLMLDILRVVHRLGYKKEELSIHLVEISDTMQMLQASRLCISHRAVDIDNAHYYEGETISGIKVYWYNDLKKVPQNFSWFLAHEFFDVLPIHKFEKRDDGWREVLINLDETGQLHYVISASETAAAKMLIRPPLDCGDRTELEISARGLGVARQLAERVDKFGGLTLIADYGHNGEKGDTFRLSTEMESFLDLVFCCARGLGVARQLAERVDKFGGLTLIADYGHNGEKGDTFRAFHKHQVVDPLEKPGECDLTADVDFSQLRIAASKTIDKDNYAIVVGPVRQKDFLERMQAYIRLEVLVENAKTEEDKEKIRAAYDMLVNHEKMGDRFKFMAFYPSAAGEIMERYPPIGFSSQDPHEKSEE